MTDKLRMLTEWANAGIPEKTVTLAEDESTAALLVPGVDPDPVVIERHDATAPLLLVCEHAGRAVPRHLNGLGLSQSQRDLHIGWDIGAGAVARDLAARFGCTLIRQRFSRLVIDCNRPPGSAQSIPEVSDGIAIPGNHGLSEADRRLRESQIFDPYSDACRRQIARENVRCAWSIHSFTPKMNGVSRVWDIGFLYRASCSRGGALADMADALWPDLSVGHNEPYRIEDETDWFIPVCAEPRGIPHALIEIRNDHLLTENGCRAWSERLYRLLSQFLEATDDPDT